MPGSDVAPGWPGIAPTWTSSAKDMVTTGIGPSRIWVTLGYGIVNEIYWPSTGRPQIRDLGFIVGGPRGWHEVKRVMRYRVSVPKPYVPLPRIIHEGDGYRLELLVVPDPLRDVLLISFRLSGENMRLYPLLAPHLGGSGMHNNARAGTDMQAWKDRDALHLTSDCGFARASVGYVGTSDGWQDFSRHGAMTWTYPEALDGNLALTGELAANEGTLALGFADSVEGARTLARSSLSEGIEAAQSRFQHNWENWARHLVIAEAPAEIRAQAFLSAAVIKMHDDFSYPGAVVASLSIPWGNSSDSTGGYHLVWTRDAVEAGLALLAAGHGDGAARMLSYLIATQQRDGCWFQNHFPDGRAFWNGVQLDEVGFPLLLAAKLHEHGALGGIHGVERMIRRAARYLVQNGPSSPQDRWEENAGINPFTLGVMIAALVAAADRLAGTERDYVLSLADYWNERIEDWTYAKGGPLAAEFGVDGYYVRVAPPLAEGGLRGRIDIRNRSGSSVAATTLIGMEYLYLARLGLRDARDRCIQNTLKVTEALLKVETPLGTAYHRYNGDGYGEHEDGSPFDGSGVGRAWPLLTGERAHLDLLLGIDPLPYLEMMVRMTGPVGLMPEQVWDTAPIAERFLEPGKPTGSAMPLVWAHSEFLKLFAARQHRRPMELLASVARRYEAKKPTALVWHWRAVAPFDALPADRDLLIEAATPFTLHYGFDGWRDIADAPSQPPVLGMHGVRLTADRLRGRAVLDFTLYDPAAACWEGEDHHIALGVPSGLPLENTLCERRAAQAIKRVRFLFPAIEPAVSEIEPALSEPVSAAPASGAASGAVPENAYGVTDKTRPWIFAASLAAMFMAAIESTIVATAMPSIVGTLGGFDLFSWVFTAYLLTQAVMIPIYGRLADIYGRKRILLIGIALFLGGSILCGFAWSMMSLIIFRVVQGIGSGAVMPVAQTLLGDLYHGEARARVQGYVSSTFASAGVFGPIAGAFIVSHTSWSVVFWVNVPLGIVASLLLGFALRERVRSRRHHIDYVGSALMTLGIGSLMFVLVQAQGLDTGVIIGLSAVAVLSLAALVAWELRVPEPMLPIKLWRNRVVVGSNVVNLASGAVAMGITAFLPAYMQAVMGSSIFVAGIALTASGVGWPAGGFVGGRLMLRTTYRKASRTGAIVAVFGALMMATLDPDRGALWAIGGAALTGLGLGAANNCFIVAIQASVGWTERGVATSSFVFMRIVGQTVGTAVFGGILNAGLSGHLAGGGDLVTRILEPTLRQAIPPAEVAPVMAAFAQALHNVYVINGVLVLVVLIATVSLPAGLRLVARRGTG